MGPDIHGCFQIKNTWFYYDGQDERGNIDFTEQLKSVPQKNLKNGLFIFTVRDEQTSWIKDKRLILITDLGFFVKQNANKTKDIFVQSIATGEAVGNAKVLVEGNYTLTITIDADDETKDSITWVRNGDCA